ncbi:MAG: hypothetical protein LBR80_04945 [Deltaproteobacteria bacterium]|nr:hypothetical protein [Deltaproteobacteria bacterium]
MTRPRRETLWTDKTHPETVSPTRPPELAKRQDANVSRSGNVACPNGTPE